jgi:hypothetical protein
VSDDKKKDVPDSNLVIGTITFGPGMGHKFEVKAESVTIVEQSAPAIDVPSLMRASGYDEGFAAGIEAAAKLMEENASEWRKSTGTQPNIAWQLDSEARHIRELLQEKKNEKA